MDLAFNERWQMCVDKIIDYWCVRSKYYSFFIRISL